MARVFLPGRYTVDHKMAFNLFLIGAGAALAFAASPVALHATAADPASRLTSYNDAVTAIMKARLPQAARTARFETLVRDSYDMPAIAALVAGPKWAGASAVDRDMAIAALTHHSAVQLAKNFASFGGEQFIVDPAVVARGTSSIVKVTIVSKGRSDVLLYRLRQAGAEWRIIDVTSQGVSQLALQRAELAATLAADGVGGMAKRLAQVDAAAQR